MALLNNLRLADVTTLIICAGYLALIVSLLRSGLRESYAWFFGYLIFQLVRSIVLLQVSYGTRVYATIYVITGVCLWIFWTGVIRELVRAVLLGYKNIERKSRPFLKWAVPLAAIASAGTLLAGARQLTGELLLTYFFLADRFIQTTLLLLLILITGFLAVYPVKLHRNARVHAAVFSFYFFLKSAVLLFATRAGPTVQEALNSANRLGVLVCLLCWIVFLSRAGELKTVESSWLSDPLLRDRLLRQLEDLNSTLEKSAK